MNDATFMRAVADRLGCDLGRAEAVIFAVFQELRDRLTPKEAFDVASQLPSRLKTLWEEGELPGRAVERVHRAEFVNRVRHRVGLFDDQETVDAIRVVLRQLQALLGSPHGIEGEAWDVFSQLPKDLKQLWLEAAR